MHLHATAIAALLFAATSALAADACYVRTEPLAAPEAAASAVAVATAASAAAPSYIGLRQRSGRLVEIDLSISGPGDANCAVQGSAKVRGDAGGEVLALVVRPTQKLPTERSGALCQVFVQMTPSALLVNTTADTCAAQNLCGGRVELDGQRFDHALRLPDGTKGPCFERRSP